MEQQEYRAQGLYFEDMRIGDRMSSPGRTVTEADVVMFSGLSGDWHEVHSDAEAARNSIFGQRVAHGVLGLSIATGLAGRMPGLAGAVQSFIGLDWRFKKPIFLGDTIHVQAEVSKKRPVKALGGGFVVLKMVIMKQDDQVVQEGEWIVLFRGRPDGRQQA